MATGSMDYKKLPEKKKVFGDKYFFIRPLNLGAKDTFKAFIVRPPQVKDEPDSVLSIEGECCYYPKGNSERYSEIKKEYKDEIVKFVYYKKELDSFPEHIREEIKTYCSSAI